jgi:Uma2 family endonuclease
MLMPHLVPDTDAGNKRRKRRWTVQEVLALPEDNAHRYELFNGELVVSPAPARLHQRIATGLGAELYTYLKQHGREGTIFMGPADIWWDDANFVQPDILVAPPEEANGSWADMKHLLLIVEILSPGSQSRRRDREVKRRLYQKNQVATYWIVDPPKRCVEIWHPGDMHAEVATDSLIWQPTPELPPWRGQVASLFS